MPTPLHHWRWSLWLLAVAWLKPGMSRAQQYLGNNLVTNGTFSSQPAGTNLAAGTNLGGWTSGRTYTGTNVYPAESQAAGQTGTETVAGNNISQVPFPGDVR